ncbi:MAG TPA: tyrosine--tRNA ligase [Candidatus Paceibacterota bacterium]|nr:tyrosine--tRNA ligase [Candidatus Paceibacterota bacterium]
MIDKSKDNEGSAAVFAHRAIDSIYPSKEAFDAALRGGKKLRIYIGADATGPHLHLGQLTNLLVLKKLQEAGHEIIFLIGDFTARIGDPSDKLASRKPLTEKEVKENYKSFKEQVGRILDLKGKNPVRIEFNSRWLAKIDLAEWLAIEGHFTHQQMIERDMFQERIKEGKPINLAEFSYPLMQGYDSVAMDVDAEIGGTDQTFNMLVGRTLLRAYKNKEKFVLTTKLLINPKTGKKIMNKSEGGLVNLDDAPQEIFGKTMALSDESMFAIAELCTEMPDAKIAELRSAVEKGGNPRDAKLDIAEAVTKTVYGATEANAAREHFEKLFSKKEAPEDAPPLGAASGTTTTLVRNSGVAKSNSEARRLVEQGALEIGGKTIKDPNLELTKLGLKGGEPVKIGKKNFFRIKL